MRERKGARVIVSVRGRVRRSDEWLAIGHERRAAGLFNLQREGHRTRRLRKM